MTQRLSRVWGAPGDLQQTWVASVQEAGFFLVQRRLFLTAPFVSVASRLDHDMHHPVCNENCSLQVHLRRR